MSVTYRKNRRVEKCVQNFSLTT